MQNINQTETEQESKDSQETKVVTKKVTESRIDKINKYNEGSERFTKATSRVVDLLPNTQTTVVFFPDWYADWDELYHEARVAKHLGEDEAITYADKNYRVRKSLRDSTEREGEQYSEHKFLVTDPNCGFPDMIKELRISSNKAVDEINKKLTEVAMKHEGKIIMSIFKKVGKTKFQVEWKIEAEPFVESPDE